MAEELKPMQGLADWLRNQAELYHDDGPKMFAWAAEVDSQPDSVHQVSRSGSMLGDGALSLPLVDWLGLALDLEAQAKRVESQTTERAILAAAHGLRLMGGWNNEHITQVLRDGKERWPSLYDEVPTGELFDFVAALQQPNTSLVDSQPDSVHQVSRSGEMLGAGALSLPLVAPGAADPMRSEFYAWVRDQGCDTDGAWSAWQAAWNHRGSLAPAKYDDVLVPFVALMRNELHANSAKGDRPGWLAMDANTALLEVYWHVAKLSAAVKNNDGPAIMEHCADVANMSMMVLDVCGGLVQVDSDPHKVQREAFYGSMNEFFLPDGSPRPEVPPEDYRQGWMDGASEAAHMLTPDEPDVSSLRPEVLEIIRAVLAASSGECENCNQLSRALGEALEPPTFMGEPVTDARAVMTEAEHLTWMADRLEADGKTDMARQYRACAESAAKGAAR